MVAETDMTPEETLELTGGISIKDRIHKLGPTLEFDEHMFLVKTSFSITSIFTGIHKGLPTTLRMLIAEIDPNIGNVYGCRVQV
mgnify:CR=1 FL=1